MEQARTQLSPFSVRRSGQFEFDRVLTHVLRVTKPDVGRLTPNSDELNCEAISSPTHAGDEELLQFAFFAILNPTAKSTQLAGRAFRKYTRLQ